MLRRVNEWILLHFSIRRKGLSIASAYLIILSIAVTIQDIGIDRMEDIKASISQRINYLDSEFLAARVGQTFAPPESFYRQYFTDVLLTSQKNNNDLSKMTGKIDKKISELKWMKYFLILPNVFFSISMLFQEKASQEKSIQTKMKQNIITHWMMIFGFISLLLIVLYGLHGVLVDLPILNKEKMNLVG